MNLAAACSLRTLLRPSFLPKPLELHRRAWPRCASIILEAAHAPSGGSIAALAGALAKAHTELTNPEKSLTAMIRADRSGEGARTFRYAPLSSGLEIVRKTLGKHEIAIFQTTAIDQPTRSVALTTTLTHSSGEWIASEWPVCPVSEMAAPHRMGAALTYARRYALFTLVGIAGEDDLDAPDLNCQPGAGAGGSPGSTPSDRASTSPSCRLAGHRPILDPEASAEARDRLLRESLNCRRPRLQRSGPATSCP